MKLASLSESLWEVRTYRSRPVHVYLRASGGEQQEGTVFVFSLFPLEFSCSWRWYKEVSALRITRYMYQSRLKYRAWQPRATLTLPSTVLQRLVYSAVFTARLVGYLNCDLGGKGGGQFSFANSSGVCSLNPRLEPVPYRISQTKNNMCPVSGLSDLNLFTRKRHVIFKPWFQRAQI